MSATTTAATTWAPMTSDQREQFDTDGYLVLKGVPSPDEVRQYASVLDAAHARHPHAPDGSLHLLSAVTSCPETTPLYTALRDRSLLDPDYAALIP